MFDAGRAPASAAQVVAAAKLRAKLAGEASPAGEATARVLAGFRRVGKDRGRGQARPMTADDLAAIIATAHRPRPRGRRGMESAATAAKRGAVDAAIAGLLFQAGLRRSEAAALEWRDVEPGAVTGTLRITVRAGKTNQAGETRDVRLVKNGAARALDGIRPADAEPRGKVFGGLDARTIGRRFQAAAKAAGIEGLSAHSGRVGLASELTARGASTTETMLAGGWKTARMVAHYSAGAVADSGAVAKYL